MKFTDKKIKEGLQNFGNAVRMNGNACKEMRAFILLKAYEDKRSEIVLKDKIKAVRDWMGFNWVSVRIATIGMIVLSVLGGSITTVSASLTSLPGDFLFPVKRTTEKLQVAMQSDGNSKTKLKMEFAGRRLEEAKTIMQSENPEKEAMVVLAMANFKTQIDNIKEDLANVAPSEATKAVTETIVELSTEAEKITNTVELVETSIVENNASSTLEENIALTDGITATETMAIKPLPAIMEDSEESFGIQLQMIEDEDKDRIEF
jgi:hypothetical protein